MGRLIMTTVYPEDRDDAGEDQAELPTETTEAEVPATTEAEDGEDAEAPARPEPKRHGLPDDDEPEASER